MEIKVGASICRRALGWPSTEQWLRSTSVVAVPGGVWMPVCSWRFKMTTSHRLGPKRGTTVPFKRKVSARSRGVEDSVYLCSIHLPPHRAQGRWSPPGACATVPHATAHGMWHHPSLEAVFLNAHSMKAAGLLEAGLCMPPTA